MGGERQVGAFVSPYAYEWFIRGNLADNRGDYRAAAEAYEQASASWDRDPLVLARLAYAWQRAGKPRRADDVLSDALADAPDAEALHLAAGNIAEHRGDTAGAIASFSRAEQCAPESERGPLALARVLAATHSMDRAQAVLSRFIERTGQGTVGTLRAQIRLALLRGDVDTAVATVEALAHWAPAGSEALNAIAREALAQNDAATAARLMTALPESQRDLSLWFAILLRLRRSDDAEAVLASHSAGDFGGVAGYATRYVDMGEAEHALELLAPALAAEREPTALFAAAKAHAALGRVRESVALLAEIPSGTSVSDAAAALLAELLAAQGLHGVSEEVSAQAVRN